MSILTIRNAVMLHLLCRLPLLYNIRVAMLNRMRLKKMMQRQQRKSALFLWIQAELSKLSNDLSDHNCRFYIYDLIEQRGNSLIIQLYVQPLTGTFGSIQFKPKIFISSFNFAKRPRIYNDRRLFHPNINMYTCEIVFPEIVRDWNPTQEFSAIFHNLKYVLLEPNLNFVPNTQFNKRAAWNYHFNKRNYQNLIIENSPLYLESLIGRQFEEENESRMEIEQHSEHCGYLDSDYWSIEILTTRKAARDRSEENELYEEERSILLLTKQIKSLEMNEGHQYMRAQQFELMES